MKRVVVGRVGKSHGLDGSFVVEDASDAPERFEVGAELVVEGEPAKVLGRRQARGRPVIRLDRRVPRGAALEVPREELAPPGDGEYYVFQLVGLRVEEEGGEPLGTVTDVIPGVANDVLDAVKSPASGPRICRFTVLPQLDVSMTVKLNVVSEVQ